MNLPRGLGLLITAATVSFAGVAMAQPAPSQVHQGPAHEYLQRAQRYGFSGAALVDRQGQVLVSGGYGLAVRDEGAEVANTDQTRFDIGALTMQFTAAAVLRLEMLGKLSVDDPLRKHFDETVLGFISERARGITLHQLMSHTSGLHGRVQLGDVDPEDRDAVVAAILAAEGPFPPGASFGYALNNYVVLAAVVERVHGKPFEAALQELVFHPAGMTQTIFCGDIQAQNVAHGHEDVPRRGEYEPIGDVGPATFSPYTWAQRGARGVLSTVTDLHKWHVALTGTQVLSPTAREKFFAPVRQNYACGWQVTQEEDGTTLIQHGASAEGYEAGMARWIGAGGEELGAVILLMNSRRGLGQRVQAALSKFVLAESAEGFPEPPPRPVPVRPGDLEALAGRFQLETGGAIEMTVMDGRLVASPAGQEAASLLNPPTQHLAPVLASTSQHAAALLKAWITGSERDVRIFRNAAHPAAAEQVDQWLERWGSDSVPGNPLRRIEVLGTFVGEGGMQTAVRLWYELAPEIIRIVWRQDQVAAIEGFDVLDHVREDGLESQQGRAQAGALAVGLLAEAEGSVATMDLGKWAVLRIRPREVEKGKVTVIEVRSGDRRVTGRRE